MCIEVLHGSHIGWQDKLFALERTFVPMGKRIYCSCHPTWLPCKTSICKCKVEVRVRVRFRVR